MPYAKGRDRDRLAIRMVLKGKRLMRRERERRRGEGGGGRLTLQQPASACEVFTGMSVPSPCQRFTEHTGVKTKMPVSEKLVFLR